MKILIVSLLRIGDIVMNAPILKNLREKYPNAQIDMLINSQCRQVCGLLPSINNFHFFDREQIQSGLGESAVPLFDSFSRVEQLLENLNAQIYTQVINLTQNRLSGWLTSLIDSPNKIGLCLDPAGRGSFNSSWLRFLNSQADFESKEAFHYNDIFRFALGLDERPIPPDSLTETPHGREEADAYLKSLPVDHGPLVAIQALTSDRKKDWGFASWQKALIQFARGNRGTTLLLLGAPIEKERLEFLASALKISGVKVELAILGFQAVFSVLKKCQMLVTCDTSIKHLGAAAKVPIVEICLGSSDPQRTGVYQHGAVIIQTREACAPCIHSQACHRNSHACAETMSATAVGAVMCEVFAGRSFQLSILNEAYINQIDIMRVEARHTGYWAAPSVLEPFSEASVARWLDLTAKKIWLSSQREDWEDSRGTEVRKLATFLRTLHSGTSEIEWRHLLSEFERQAQFVEGRMNGFKAGIQFLKGSFEDPKKMQEFIRGIISFREKLKHSVLLASFRQSLEQIIENDLSPAFTKFRRISDVVHEIENKNRIYLRLARALTGELEVHLQQEQGVERA